jgi:catalase
LLSATPAVDDLLNEAAARDFVADAFQHCKFIGYTADAKPLLTVAGIVDKLDEGTIELPGESLAAFVEALGKLRIWGREPSVKLGKASVPPAK